MLLPPEREFRMIKAQLKFRGIECPVDCFCNDPNIRSLVIKGRKLNNEVEQLTDILEWTFKKIFILLSFP